MNPPCYYNRLGHISVTKGGNLPHWAQACASFVTFRLGDALPSEKREQRQAELSNWMAAHPEPWDVNTAAEYHDLFTVRLQKWLDAGYGACILRNDNIRNIVEECLRHFADQRYSLYAYVVMPNHVHVLFMPENGYDGRRIVAGWKSFTAKAINEVLGTTGALWQKESYDHLVRDVNEFNAIRAYIRQNDERLAFDAYREGDDA